MRLVILAMGLFVNFCVMTYASRGWAAPQQEATNKQDAAAQKATRTADDSSSALDANQSEAIEFKSLYGSEFASFPVNWAAESTYRFALIRKPDEFEQVFQPAAVAGNKKPYAPPAELYEQEMIVLVGRVTPAPSNLDKSLQIESILAKDKTLEVRFSFRPGPKSASYTVKVTGMARLPQRDVTRVVFFEGEKQVGELKIEDGEWLLPAPPNSED